MDTASLREFLEQALAAKSEAAPSTWRRQFYHYGKNPKLLDPRTLAFLQALEAQPELAPFNTKVHLLGGIPHTPDYGALGEWLIERAVLENATTAIANLSSYISGEC